MSRFRRFSVFLFNDIKNCPYSAEKDRFIVKRRVHLIKCRNVDRSFSVSSIFIRYLVGESVILHVHVGIEP